jgi:hypothetical protein
MTRGAAALAVFVLAPALAFGQETILVEPLDPPADPATDPVTEILDQIAPPEEGLIDGESTLPSVPDRPTAEAASAPGGVVRVLDKISGQVTDLDLPAGEAGVVGSLSVTLLECRYPAANPAGDAYILLSIRYRGPEPVFLGWMIASAPAVSALDHPRYDVWALGCSLS